MRKWLVWIISYSSLTIFYHEIVWSGLNSSFKPCVNRENQPTTQPLVVLLVLSVGCAWTPTKMNMKPMPSALVIRLQHWGLPFSNGPHVLTPTVGIPLSDPPLVEDRGRGPEFSRNWRSRNPPRRAACAPCPCWFALSRAKIRWIPWWMFNQLRIHPSTNQLLKTCLNVHLLEFGSIKTIIKSGLYGHRDCIYTLTWPMARVKYPLSICYDIWESRHQTQNCQL